MGLALAVSVGACSGFSPDEPLIVSDVGPEADGRGVGNVGGGDVPQGSELPVTDGHELFDATAKGGQGLDDAPHVADDWQAPDGSGLQTDVAFEEASDGVSDDRGEGIDGGAVAPKLGERSMIERNPTALARLTLSDTLSRLAPEGVSPQELYLSLILKFMAVMPEHPELGCDGQLNGYPVRCDLFVNLLATEFDAWYPLDVVNRFDRAPEFGEHCGEQHLTFYHRKAPDASLAMPAHAYLRLSAIIPNPHPELGLEGCRPVTDFWAALSSDAMSDPHRRALRHQRAFMGEQVTGEADADPLGDPFGDVATVRAQLDGFGPFIHPDNFGRRGRVQMLFFGTFSESSAPVYHFYEFAINQGQIEREPVSQSFAVGPLLHGQDPEVPATLCQEDLVESVSMLLADDPNVRRINVHPACFSGASSSEDPRLDYWLTTNPDSALYLKIKNKITELDPRSTLTVEKLGERAQLAGTCVGCHTLASNSLELAKTFAHVSEDPSEPCAPTGVDHQQSCHSVSAMLRESFLPYRLDVFQRFVDKRGQYLRDHRLGPSLRTIDQAPIVRTNP